LVPDVRRQAPLPKKTRATPPMFPFALVNPSDPRSVRWSNEGRGRGAARCGIGQSFYEARLTKPMTVIAAALVGS